MEESGSVAEGEDLLQKNQGKEGSKGKSCKGCLYYSSLLKSDARNPLCVGVSRTLQQVPSSIVGESEIEASKEGRSLSDFKYVCVGYSVFLDAKDNPNEQQENQAELPFCVGIELLLDKRVSNADHVPAHAHNKEGSRNIKNHSMVMFFISHGPTNQPIQWGRNS
ncbi:uncharacterized protein LOC131252852 isoform X3 [Magnolia sinica]|uniref:uncharacterized protein LOC131252852 isoform X3 n=1 Tax=Magnolia sinica TaxID=86752 RepID=UPI00265A0A4D|nr:uncharacterized protein LOC131252852 isoform X3 [Magnolia sinica]